MMDPTYLFTDVGMFIDIGIKAPALEMAFRKVISWRSGSARSHHNPVDGAIFQGPQ